MPFLKFEITKNIYNRDQVRTLLKEASATIQECFNQFDIPVKSAVYISDDCLIDDGSQYQAFAYITIYCFTGRGEKVKRVLSERLADLLVRTYEKCGINTTVAVYFIEIERASTDVRYLNNTS